MVEESVRRIVDQVPGWSAERAEVTPLSGGITNRNYRVDLGGESFVLRIGGEGTELLGIDRGREHAASVIAAGLGVGAEVVHFLPAARAMVTRFVSGKGITPEAAAEPEMLGRIARTIRRYHEGPAFPGSFSAFETVRGYHELARARGVRFPEAAPRALALLGEIERAVVPPAELLPCHNDLLAANFIDDGAAIRILDWEYAGMGDPYFDLGNFAANQKLDPAAAEELLRRYLGKPRRQDLARLQLMRLASDMRESFWGFLQAGISKLDFDFLKYGRDHLERFLKAAAAPSFGRWIEAAGR